MKIGKLLVAIDELFSMMGEVKFTRMNAGATNHNECRPDAIQNFRESFQ